MYQVDTQHFLPCILHHNSSIINEDIELSERLHSPFESIYKRVRK